MKNRHLRSINKLYWRDDEVTAMERLLEVYRYPGAPLRLIAENLGVAEIIEEDLPFEGGIFESHGRTTIKLNALSPIGRRRFILAHELGHLIFVQRFGVDTQCMEDAELEDACDRLAAELLMPRCETIEFVGKLGDPSPEKLKSLAQKLGVSLQVAARRLRDLDLWTHSIGFWKYRGKPRQLWFVGKKLWRRPPDFVAFDLARSSSVSVSTVESLPDTEYRFGIALQMLSLRRDHFLGLITTRR